MRATTSIQLTAVAIKEAVEDVVEDKIVVSKKTIVPPMAMAAIVVEEMTTVTTVVTMIAITLITTITTNVIVPQVLLICNLVAQ